MDVSIFEFSTCWHQSSIHYTKITKLTFHMSMCANTYLYISTIYSAYDYHCTSDLKRKYSFDLVFNAKKKNKTKQNIYWRFLLILFNETVKQMIYELLDLVLIC